MTVENDFLVSFVADARGGTCCSRRLAGFRIVVPPNCLDQPTRICARAARAKSKLKLMDGESHSSKIIEFSPVRFNGNIAVDIPCAMADRVDRDFIVLTSDDCDHWKQQNFKKSEASELENSRRIVLNILPKFILIYNRHRMVSLNVGPGGGILPAMDGRTKVEFPPGALTKPTNVMIQSFPILSNCCPAAFAAGPILTLEPRRRRFHQNVNYYIPAPSIDLAVFNCHILCSITEGTTEAEWKDVTNSVEIVWHNSVAKFSGNVSGRFWLVFTKKDVLTPQSSIVKIANQVYQKTIRPKSAVSIEAICSKTGSNEYLLEVHVTSSVTLNGSCSLLVDEYQPLQFDFYNNTKLIPTIPLMDDVRYEPFSNSTVKYRLTLNDDINLSTLCCRLKTDQITQIPVTID